MQKRTSKILVTFALSFGFVVSTQASEESNAVAAVRASLLANAKDLEITTISATPIPNIFEVVANQEVLYVDQSGRYAFLAGRLIDIVAKTDLSQATIDRLTQISWAALPKDLAIKRVIGSGRRELAIFADPACPICRRLDSDLGRLRDVTVYIYTLPIISPESTPSSIAVWCSPPSQRLARWESLMAGGAAPQLPAPPTCSPAREIVQRIAALGERYGIQNTPTIVFPDSRRIIGAMPLEEIDAALTDAYASNANTNGGAK